MDEARPTQADAFPGLESLGTRFRVYPQPPFVGGYEQPETVWISTRPGEILPGPADRRMYVIDPLLAKPPYATPYFPPWTGDANPPAEAGPSGHFDHIPVESRAFISAHAFACVRRVLDICESYLGQEVPWFFAPTYERLEIIPRLEWRNAQSGFGFLELGEDDTRETTFPFALNFDVVAHETAHLVLFGVLGLPESPVPSEDYLTFHETAADFVSILSLLQFDSALDKILRRTRGNLLVTNELDRLVELVDDQQVRVASHSLKLRDVGHEVHDRSKPFTGALFDSLIEIFQLLLVERGLSYLDPRGIASVRAALSQADVDRELSIEKESYEVRHFAVKAALQEARDIMGEAFIRSWSRLQPDTLSLAGAADACLSEIESGRGWRFADRIYDNLAWRELFTG
jgi:hypothetical protein